MLHSVAQPGSPRFLFDGAIENGKRNAPTRHRSGHSAASCAFMLQIGTLPNPIGFGTGRIRMSQMAGYGLIISLAVVLATISTLWLMVPQLGIQLP
jgi:hypothetical protein